MCVCNRLESCSFRNIRTQLADTGMLGMFTNSFEGSQRQAERVATFKSRHRRRLAIPRRLQKRNNLRTQRFDVDYIEMLHVYARPGAARRRRRETAYRSAFRRVVDRDVIVRLKE